MDHRELALRVGNLVIDSDLDADSIIDALAAVIAKVAVTADLTPRKAMDRLMVALQMAKKRHEEIQRPKN